MKWWVFTRLVTLVLAIQNLYFAWMDLFVWHRGWWWLSLLAAAVILTVNFSPPWRSYQWVFKPTLILFSTLRHPRRTWSRVRARQSPIEDPPWMPRPLRKSPSLPRQATTRPVIGYRTWRVTKKHELCATVWNARTWRPGVNHATCARDPLPWHGVPNSACECGFYAHHRPQRICMPSEVMGVILAHGKIVRHGEEGFRAEKAQVIAFLVPPYPFPFYQLHDSFLADPDAPNQLRRLADRYDVPVLAWGEAEKFAAPYGQSIGVLG